MDYPIIFRIRHLVRCGGFEALVTAEGRCLMTAEDGLWWCHGVEPGGLTDSGEGPLTAYEAFRVSFRQSVEDLCTEAQSDAEADDTMDSFKLFKENVEGLFATDDVEASRWDAALEKLREMEAGGKALDPQFSKMERIPPRTSRILIQMTVKYANSPITTEDSETFGLPKAA